MESDLCRRDLIAFGAMGALPLATRGYRLLAGRNNFCLDVSHLLLSAAASRRSICAHPFYRDGTLGLEIYLDRRGGWSLP
jgi:hypothetical protein